MDLWPVQEVQRFLYSDCSFWDNNKWVKDKWVDENRIKQTNKNILNRNLVVGCDFYAWTYCKNDKTTFLF